MLFAHPGCSEQCCSESRSMQWRNTAVGDKGAVFHFGGFDLGEVAERMHCLVFCLEGHYSEIGCTFWCHATNWPLVLSELGH